MRSIDRQDAGFTLMELMIVMAIIGVLAMLAVPSFIGALKSAKEAVLKEDLHVLRAAIDSYTMDKQKAPQSLDDLIQDGYLKKIPVDPMTKSKRNLGDGNQRTRCARWTRPIPASTTSTPGLPRPVPTASPTPPGELRVPLVPVLGLGPRQNA